MAPNSLTRPLLPSDLAKVKDLHERLGFDYKIPDLASHLVAGKVGSFDRRTGRLIGAAAIRYQVEAYLWLDPDLSIAERLRVVLDLHSALLRDAMRLGLDCAVAYLPPNIPRSFRRLLSKLGWSRDREGWESWSRPIT